MPTTDTVLLGAKVNATSALLATVLLRVVLTVAVDCVRMYDWLLVDLLCDEAALVEVL